MSKITIEFLENTTSVGLDDVSGSQIEAACGIIVNSGLDNIPTVDDEEKTAILAYIIGEVVHSIIGQYIGSKIDGIEDEAEKLKIINAIPNIHLLKLIEQLMSQIQAIITKENANEKES